VSVVEITGIAAGGDGVGRLDDGIAVFVPRAAPGDVIDVEVVERHRRYARGRIRVLHNPSAERIEPQCPHYVRDQCGGCQLQHLSLDAQRAWKSRIVGDALRRIGRVEIDDPPITASEEVWRYRTRVTLAARGGKIGLRRAGSPEDVFELDDCLITRESLMAVWRVLRTARRALPEELDELQLRQDRTGRQHVIVRTGAPTRAWDPAPLVKALGDAVTVWWRPHGGAARTVAGDSEAFPALAFEQVHPLLADQIRSEAVKMVAPRPGERAWDLYGGVGDTARRLAGEGAEVWSVDTDRGAVEWARRQAQGDGSGAIHWLAELVEEALPRLPEPDAAIVNPPRAGLSARVAARLSQWGESRKDARLAYVSCDPATLARDVARLTAFRIASVRAYDLFPQTSHVETLAVLEAA